MSWTIKKKGSNWEIIKKSISNEVSPSDSEKKARASVGEKYVSENKKKV